MKELEEIKSILDKCGKCPPFYVDEECKAKRPDCLYADKK